jgi:omega-hydroxy-beta-dihydromenaquinone-9 sulfotransferase
MSALTPIYVFGAGHSGTTILYKMTALHPDTTWFTQYSQRGGRIPGRMPLPFHNQIQRLLLSTVSPTWRKETGRPQRNLRRIIVPTPNEARGIWSHLVPTNPVDRETSIHRIRTVFEAEHSFWGRPFLVAKPLWLYRHLDILHEAHPNARFVHIVRDGRAVALSLRPKFSRSGATSAEALGGAARRWVEVLACLREAGDRMDVLEIRYEDMCEDVHETLGRVMGFTGLLRERFPLDRVPQTLTPTNARWIDRAADWELELLTREEAEDLQRHGYAAGT